MSSHWSAATEAPLYPDHCIPHPLFGYQVTGSIEPAHGAYARTVGVVTYVALRNARARHNSSDGPTVLELKATHAPTSAALSVQVLEVSREISSLMCVSQFFFRPACFQILARVPTGTSTPSFYRRP